MTRRVGSWSACGVLAALFPFALPSCVTTEQVAQGLSAPVFVTHAPGDSSRVFIIEQPGRIRSLRLATGQLTTFLDIRTLVSDGSETGLLGLAFHPNYVTNGLFYVHYSAVADAATQIVEYRRSTTNPNVADPSTARLLLAVAQPQGNHNGGWIGCDDNGWLYIALGDGGNGYDDGTGHTPDIGNAQDLTDNLLGKVLRIIPTGDDFPGDPNKNYAIPADNPFVGVEGDDEIWAYGLRNPWRCSFDRQTGDLWIADVGQSTREEINFQPADFPGGANYGWRLREGRVESPSVGIGGPEPADHVAPIYDYLHGAGQFEGLSVTGGYVYRGPIQELQGQYVFADFATAQIWSIQRTGGSYSALTDWTSRLQPATGTITTISSFGEDANGNLYICDLGGEVYRVVRQSAASRLSATLRKLLP